MKGNAKPQKVKRDVVPSRYNYGFLFKKSQLPKADLRGMFFVEEFVNKLDAVMDNGKGVEDEDIYKITCSIYFPLLKAFEDDDFKNSYKQMYGGDAYRALSSKCRTCARAVKKFSCALYGFEKWHDEYAEFLSAN